MILWFIFHKGGGFMFIPKHIVKRKVSSGNCGFGNWGADFRNFQGAFWSLVYCQLSPFGNESLRLSVLRASQSSWLDQFYSIVKVEMSLFKRGFGFSGCFSKLFCKFLFCLSPPSSKGSFWTAGYCQSRSFKKLISVPFCEETSF